MLNASLLLADPKSSGMRGNATVWSRSITISVTATNTVSFYKKFHFYIITKLYCFQAVAPSHPLLLS